MPTEKLKVQKVSFSETDGVSRAPLPDWRRYVPYSAPHPEADDMVPRGVVRESTWKSSGWIGACRLRVQGESSPWEHGHNLQVGLPTVSSWTRLLASMCRQKWGGLPYFQLAITSFLVIVCLVASLEVQGSCGRSGLEFKLERFC